MHAWHWLGGWRPELLGHYLALYPVPDVELLINLVQCVRDLVPQRV